MELPLPLSLALQKGIDSYLRSDPFVLEQLAPLRSHVVRFEVTAPTLSLTLGFVETGIEVMRHHDGEVDTTIRGSLAHLLAIRTDNAPLYRKDVSIDGDMGVALNFKKILSGIDLDIEGLVTPWVGGTLAHQASRLVSEAQGWFERSLTGFEQNAGEYLTEEAEWVAPDSGIAGYVDAVDEIRAETDRVEARIALMEQGDSRDQ